MSYGIVSVKKMVYLLIVVMLVGGVAMAERNCFEELRKLGVEISDRAEEYVRAQMESYMEYGFTETDTGEVLFSLGSGEYNKADGTITPLTDSVYAFDTEMTWIEEDYRYLMDAVKRMSGGTADIQNVKIEIGEETAEAGWGDFPISFEMNGEACSYTAKLDCDWMDLTFLDFLNEKLKGIPDGRQLWFNMEDGQTVLMFYRDKAWIDGFSAATGIGFFDNWKAEVSFDPFAFLGDWMS